MAGAVYYTASDLHLHGINEGDKFLACMRNGKQVIATYSNSFLSGSELVSADFKIDWNNETITMADILAWTASPGLPGPLTDRLTFIAAKEALLVSLAAANLAGSSGSFADDAAVTAGVI